MRYEVEREELKERFEMEGKVWCEEEVMKRENREEFFRMMQKVLRRKEELEAGERVVRGGVSYPLA